MPNRQKAPQIHPLTDPELIPYTKKTTANGVNIYILHDPNQEIFKLDFIFDAGSYFQYKPLLASTTLHMLNEGTRQHDSANIAELFDYYGAYIDFNPGMHRSELSLLSLNKYAGEVIAQLGEMVTESVFPEKELEIHLRNSKQNFLTQQEKTGYLAKKEFSRLLFGAQHPYANTIGEQDFEQITTADAIAFYRQNYHAGNARVMLSGNIEPEILAATVSMCEKLPGGAAHPAREIACTPDKPGRYHITKKEAVQTSIRVGKKGLRITDEDYVGFQLLNTVLGGYFGSRLMSNIREEKGYTYGIQSMNVSLPQGSYWCVASDVSSEYTEDTLTEIRKEIRILQEELVSEEELALVKNYYYGEILRELDGVFEQSDTLKHKLIYQTDNRFYLSTIKKIKDCQPEQLRELARKYLPLEELYFVTAGGDLPKDL